MLGRVGQLGLLGTGKGTLGGSRQGKVLYDILSLSISFLDPDGEGEAPLKMSYLAI